MHRLVIQIRKVGTVSGLTDTARAGRLPVAACLRRLYPAYPQSIVSRHAHTQRLVKAFLQIFERHATSEALAALLEKFNSYPHRATVAE